MSKELAFVKKAYLITLSAGKPETVLLDKEPDWQKMIQEKHVVKIDGMVINFAFAVSAKEVDLADDGVDSTMAYAKSLKGAWKVVACERVRGYEAKNGMMPLQKLKDWLEDFRKLGKTAERFAKRYDMYIGAGGDPNDIG